MSSKSIVKSEKMQRLKGLLEKSKDSFADVLPSHMRPERLIKTALYVAATNPGILECEPSSFLAACMKAAQLGLEPTGEYGGGHFVRYGNSCVFLPDYRGVLDVVRRSGKVDAVESRVIYESDIYSVDFMANPPVQHQPCLDGDRGKPVAYYAIAWLKDVSRPQFEIMRRDEVDAHRRKLKSGGSDAWRSYFDRMALKTVLLRLCNLLPRSIEMMLVAEASQQGDRQEAGPSMVVIPEVEEVIVQPTKQNKTASVIEKLNGDMAKVADEPEDIVVEAEVVEVAGLPKMDELRAIADRLGVDISHYGRRRTDIWTYLQGVQEEQQALDEAVQEDEFIEPPEVADGELDADVHERQRLNEALRDLTGPQLGNVIDQCDEYGIDDDSSKWSKADVQTIYGFIKEA